MTPLGSLDFVLCFAAAPPFCGGAEFYLLMFGKGLGLNCCGECLAGKNAAPMTLRLLLEHVKRRTADSKAINSPTK